MQRGNITTFFSRILKTLILIMVGVFLFVSPSVNAATTSKAQLVTTLPALSLKPGETKTLSIQFKNTGSIAWTNSGEGFVSMYVDPSTYKSPFYNTKWVNSNQLVKMKEKLVKTGGVGTFEITLTAPKKEGIYQERFKIARENKEWIAGSYFTLPISVGTPAPPKVISKPEVTPLSGMVLIKSAPLPALAGGETATIQVGFKNNGTQTWKNVRLIEPTGNVVTALAPEEEYATGRLALVSAQVKAPAEVGHYVKTFHLSVNDVEVPGTLIEIPLEVTSPGIIDVPSTPAVITPPSWTGVPQPLMRVGLTMLDQAIISVNSAYQILDGNGRQYAVMNTGEQATIVFDPGTFGQQLTYNGAVYTTDTYFRLVPVDMTTGVFTLENYQNRPDWNKSLNDNRFRGTFEMRRNTGGYVWLVNELPLEDYVAGIAEASNPWPMEFHKALAIATRSYADYYIQNAGKYKGSSHYLNASAADQVYKGYGAELRNPRFVEGVRATRGVVIRYNGAVAFAPFYSRSDGMTRSHLAVYGRNVPYLVARPAEYDVKVGKSLWGHGVGMPMTDAALRADAGFLYPEILNAYYTGISIDRVYE